MGSFDCYCAICAGPLGIGFDLGANTEKVRAWRRRYIDKQKRRRAGEEVPDSDDEDKPMTDGEQSGAESEEEEEEEEFDADEESYKYNPEVITEKDTAWLADCRCLGYNKNVKGTSKTYISGPGRYTDYGSFEVAVAGNDPNDPHGAYYNCYMSVNEDMSPVFPFHEACYQLLARRLFNVPDIQRIDKDTLYSTMSRLYQSEWASTLNLSYGHSNVMEQFWLCILGEEWIACDPSLKPEAGERLKTDLCRKFEPKPVTRTALGDKVRSDPFSKLPYDILYMIFPFLDRVSTFALMRASWHIFDFTRDGAFWKQMIRLDILPWLWELGSILTDDLPALDSKALYFWLENNMKGEFGMEGPYMAIANRRRIWSVCGEIADEYAK